MKVVLVDDERENRRLIELFFRMGGDGVELLSFAEPGEAVQAVRRHPDVALVISDLVMPGMSGGDVLEAVKAVRPDVPVIIVSGHGTIDKAVALLKAGAYDFVTRPFKREAFMNRVRQALDKYRLSQEVSSLRKRLAKGTREAEILAASPRMLAILDKLPSIARSNAPVLIRGESGTGKELIAREVHRLSQRSGGPFVAINCGAIPAELLESELFGARRGSYTGAYADRKGVIREANKGTLFLDEIGDMAIPLQVKLLRFLQEGEIRPVGESRSFPVDVRVVAATNRPLEQSLQERTFRNDLYYRLNVLPIHLPPLRERREDIPLLADHFLRKFSGEAQRSEPLRLSAGAIQKLCDYDWPGNIRELESAIYRAVVMATGPEIGPSNLPLGGEESIHLYGTLETKSYREAKREVVARFEISYVTKLLEACKGNVPEAARRAGQDRKSFWRIMTRHGIDPAAFR